MISAGFYFALGVLLFLIVLALLPLLFYSSLVIFIKLFEFLLFFGLPFFLTYCVAAVYFKEWTIRTSFGFIIGSIFYAVILPKLTHKNTLTQKTPQ